ncbi:YdeI/OmpD-associated family protein [Pedobacter sp. FW305-3-2-15-E-R2A2]|uniref:YdeI/OmpD-associated family protein n=1 Tax=Pedobacter sp. FW305-3-2-15-E-R2A2 TaxID=3140251 RepID=UPI00314019EB
MDKLSFGCLVRLWLYQQNDYLGWIERAKLPDTKEKRMQQMLTELKNGTVYMKMNWKSKQV